MTGRRAPGFKPAWRLAMLPVMQIRTVPALFAILFVALSLAGCGRKGALDLPPSAAAAAPPTAEEKKEAETKTISPISKPPKPKPRVVPKRDLPIDILLN
jgi:predicted small lipoprotein YifL